MNKASKRLFLAAGVVAILMTSSFAAAPRFYVRNREVQGRVVGSDVYLSAEQLNKVLSPEDWSKVRWSPDGQVQIGSATIQAESGAVSMDWVAQQLGLSKRSGPGTVDWLKVTTSEEASSLAPEVVATNARRPEYREAGRRLQEIATQIPVSLRQDYAERVERIGRQVVRVTPLRDLEWHFLVLRAREPNAACTGEGHVFVTESLLDMGLNDDELAGVLGHEVAHGVRRHTFRRSDLLRDIKNLLRDYVTLQTRLDNGEDSFSLRQQISTYSRRRDDLQYRFDHDRFYSHIDEEEADVLGMRYAVTAGFSAEGLGNALRRLEELQVKQFGTAVLQDDMSHPPVKRRLQILQVARRNGGF